MEEYVNNQIDELIDIAGICHCDQCRADVEALALNTLPPKYVVTVGGEVFARVNAMETQMQADIMTAIISGINMVKAKPRHSPEDQQYINKSK